MRDRRRIGLACRLGFVGLLAFLAVSQARSYLKIDTETFKPDLWDFWLAGRGVLEGENFYELGRRWYVYPPMLAVLFAPLALLPLGWAGAVWACINTAVIGTGTWVGVKEMARRLAAPVWAPAMAAVVPAAALMSSVVLADKSRAVIRLGQTDGLVVLACVLALRWMGRRPVWSGLALAFAANIKYQSLVFLPYLIVRRRWKEAASAAVGAVGIALSTALIFGWERNLEYIGRALRSLARLAGTQPPADDSLQPIHPLTWHRSVSFPSVIGRMVEAGHWPQWVVVAGVAALAALVFGASWAVYAANGQRLWRGRGGVGDDITAAGRAVVGLEWVGLMVALTAFSPQTSARHMFLVMVPVCAASVLILSIPNGRAKWTALAGLIVLLLGLVLPPGGRRWESAVEGWRWIGGASWCLLAMWFTLLWAGLQRARALPAGEPDTSVGQAREGQ